LNSPQPDPSKLNGAFLTILCKRGIKRENVVASVNSKLRKFYLVENPIQHAIDAVKPVLQYKKMKGMKKAVPVLLPEKRQTNTAIKWIIESALSKNYKYGPCLERGLFDEINSIIQGTSSVYQKRYMFHKNPNQ
jgi:ribosomal protein S7